MNAATDGATTVIGNLQAWAAQPFTTSMNLQGWALFTGLILVLTILWIMVLRDLKGEI